jgi:hypothetical protein
VCVPAASVCPVPLRPRTALTRDWWWIIQSAPDLPRWPRNQESPTGSPPVPICFFSRALSIVLQTLRRLTGRYVVEGTALALTCHVCKHSPKVDAQQVSCCRYSFCKQCLVQSGQRGSVVRCPLCRTTDAGVSKDRTYDDSLQLVLVRCTEAPCCAWQGAFTAVEKHEESCEVRSRPHTIPISLCRHVMVGSRAFSFLSD